MNKLELHSKTFGDKTKPAMVFLHAFPFTGDMWRDQVEVCSKDFYCVVPDLPGFGKSALPNVAITFEGYVDAVFDHLKDLGISKSIWCGLSMGGYLALRMYERDHDACLGLVLCDTKSAADNNETKLKRWGGIKASQKSREEFVETQMKALLSKTSQLDEKIKKRVAELMNAVSAEGIAQGLVALATRTDSIVTLVKIRVPSLIIVGEDDAVTPVGEATTMNEGIESSQLFVVKQAGHLSNLENPKEFNGALLDFLKQLA